jgi:opacity protein-like surface antigen
MDVKLLFGLLFLVCVTAVAQDKKWSVDANYAVIPDDGFGGDNNVIDFGLKYRFADFDFLQLGFGVNGGFSKNDVLGFNGNGSLTKSFYVQPRVFSEFIIRGSEKLRPSIGLGYSIVNDDVEGRLDNENIMWITTNGGFNLNLGLSYDITTSLFVQVQYDLINVNYRDEITFQGVTTKQNFNDNLNNVRLGVGFRF